MKRTLNKIIFLILASASAFAQIPDYHVQVLDESSGIKNFTIRSICKDNNGFLWILNHDRIQRFDGRQVKTFLLSEYPISVLCDRENHTWVTTKKQVLQFKNDHTGFLPVSINDTSQNTIGNIFQIAGGKVYLQSANGFYIYDSTHNNFKSVDFGINNLKINAQLFTYCNHTIFFSAGDSVYSFNLDNNKLRSLPVKSIFSMEAISDDKLLLSDWNYVTTEYNFKTSVISRIDISQFFSRQPDSFFYIHHAVRLDTDHYIVSSFKGLLQFNTVTGSFNPLHLFYRGRPLNVERAYAMYKDSNQTIWIGYDGGILFFSAKEGNIGLIRSSETDEGKKTWKNNVRNFAEDEKGNIWFVTTNGFNYWNLSSGDIQSFPSQNSGTGSSVYPSIRGLAYDGKNVLLGPTNFGLRLYNPQTREYKKPVIASDSTGIKLKNKIGNDFINQIKTVKNGDHIIAAKSGVYILKADSYQLVELPLPEKEKSRIFSYEDMEHRIWVGAVNAIYCFDTAYHLLFQIPTPSPENYFRCIIEYRPNEFLAGAKGLYSFSLKEKDSTLKKSEPFFDASVINFLFKDKLERMWIGSDNGLFLYSLHSRKIESFDYSDNLQGTGFNTGAIFLSSKGILYIGGLNGINYFRPEDMHERNEKLHVSILNMIVNEDDSSYLTNTLPAKLSHLQNSLRFEFVVPYYKNAKRIHYRFKLEGLKKDWVDNGNNNFIFFTSLAPGSYQFTASASLNGVDWFQSNSVSFIIRSPFWKTWWFFLLCFFAIVGILFLLYRFRINQLTRLQAVRNKISSELHDDIGSKLTNINILTMLTKKNIKQPVLAKAHLERISTEIQTSSEALDDIVWSINNRNDSLEDIIARMRRYASEVLSEQKVDFNILLPDDVQHIKFPMDKKHDMYLLFKEIINNIHKHANATEVSLEVLIKRSGLTIHIKDNGIGFNSSLPASGNGMINMKQRTEKWHGIFQLISLPGRGTEITIRIPLKTTNTKRL